MIAEWLATGRGHGSLMNRSRGYMDFSMIWTVAVVSVLLSVVFYQLAQWAENRLTRRHINAHLSCLALPVDELIQCKSRQQDSALDHPLHAFVDVQQDHAIGQHTHDQDAG